LQKISMNDQQELCLSSYQGNQCYDCNSFMTSSLQIKKFLKKKRKAKYQLSVQTHTLRHHLNNSWLLIERWERITIRI